jgi:hypothetical protein
MIHMSSPHYDELARRYAFVKTVFSNLLSQKDIEVKLSEVYQDYLEELKGPSKEQEGAVRALYGMSFMRK